jgi:small subunit ribosomal protein S6
MRRYELMLVLRPDLSEDGVQGTLDRTTRAISGSGGQIVKVSPWGRRRLAYPIGPHREGSYYIVVFDAPSETILEVERGLRITEEAMRHLVTRIEKPAATRRAAVPADAEAELPPPEEVEPEPAFIDESESEAAPAAIEQ